MDSFYLIVIHWLLCGGNARELLRIKGTCSPAPETDACRRQRLHSLRGRNVRDGNWYNCPPAQPAGGSSNRTRGLSPRILLMVAAACNSDPEFRPVSSRIFLSSHSPCFTSLAALIRHTVNVTPSPACSQRQPEATPAYLARSEHIQAVLVRFIS
jgi:hypothetical protein